MPEYPNRFRQNLLLDSLKRKNAMPTFRVTLSRPATEFAIVEADAKNEIDAVNLAFKEIDRLQDISPDPRVKLVSLTLNPSAETSWEEVSVEKLT